MPPAVPTGQRVPDLLSLKVREGELGVKSGRGFHEWTAEKIEELRARLTRALVQAAGSPVAESASGRGYNVEVIPPHLGDQGSETLIAMKAMITLDAAVAIIHPGATIMIGGFFGVGSPSSTDPGIGRRRPERPHDYHQ